MLQRLVTGLVANSPRVRRYWAEAQRREGVYRLPRGELDELLSKRLHAMLRHAAQNVPYYRGIFTERGWDPNRAEQYWAQWPILTQTDLQTHRDQLLADGVSADQVWLDSSGGSTGFIKTFYHSTAYRANHTPEVYWADSLAGWNPRSRSARLWGSGKDVTRFQSWRNIVRNWLRHDRMFDAFNMSDEIAHRHHEGLSHWQPDIMICYAGALYEFAKFLKRAALRPNYPRVGLISSAEPLTPTMRSLIEEVFPVRVFNRYGSREVGITAMECEAHEGMHLTALHSLVEVIDPQTAEQSWETEGNVVVTSLSEEFAPLIRYEVGDTAVATTEPCNCGRTTNRLRKIVGKMHDFLQARDGRRVYGEYFTHLLYAMPHVRRFQFRQATLDEIELQVVSDRAFSSSETARIEAGVQEALGPAVRTKVVYVDDIPTLASGKYRFVVSELG